MTDDQGNAAIPGGLNVSGDHNRIGQRDYIENQEIHNHNYLARNLSSKLATVVRVLDEQLVIQDYSDSRALVPYEIVSKINYNDLNDYKGLVMDYGNYGGIYSSVLTTLDQEKPNSKSRFLAAINQKYLNALTELRGEYAGELSTIEIVKKDNNGDKIMVAVSQSLTNEFENSDNRPEDVDKEDLTACINVIVCAAFIDCKILEEPARE